MAQVLCDDCVKTYKPYTYRETLQRALVSGVDEWQDIDDESHITSRYNRKWFEWLELIDNEQFHLNKYGYRSCMNMNESILKLFPCVDDFRACHAKFHKERQNKISAAFLCFDCEKYLCVKCITCHSEHFTFSKDDKNNRDNWDNIETKILHAFNTEGDTKEEYIKQERAVLCNVVDVRDSVSEREWEEFVSSGKDDTCELDDMSNSIGRTKFGEFMSNVEDNAYKLGSGLIRDYVAWDMCILKNDRKVLVINDNSTRIKIFNISSYEQIDSIELLNKPAGITEIPSTDPSQSLIAVSFPGDRQVNIMNIQRKPADVISTTNVQGRCYDLAYCNKKLITRCKDNPNGELRHSIHVMDVSGEIINIIDLHKLPDIKPWWLYTYPMSINPDSETIYVCHHFNSLTCLSLSGQVLHSTRFTDIIPRNICVDSDQNVYVMGYSLPLYKLFSDLSEIVKIVDREDAIVSFGLFSRIVHHNNTIYLASDKSLVYIFNVC